MPADGEPIPMSEFTLGERYGSKEMYRDFPDLKPGDRVTVEKDGVLYTDTVTAMRWQSPEWVAPPERTWWQRVVRKLTPPRLRKPLPQSPPKPATVTVQVGQANPLERHQRQVADIQRMIGGFDNP